MTNKPPICLSCNGTHFEIKPFEFTIEIDEMFFTMKTDTWKCQECGTPAMSDKQMNKALKLIDLTKSNEKAKNHT